MENKIDKNIKRFCQLVVEINELNNELDVLESKFYDGGYSFEEVNGDKIQDLVLLQEEFKKLINIELF